ncbi:OmpP1/FadL family transporter [Photobacterium sp. DNB23_23_1]|uniref:Outer membrane protein transport protein n=1 Tax=Photobacterium pectinilyticum TaxID=2906793 RepID=A0ABT1N4D3_9GAMM|nr:outer membrane protein transport protein [Photobacterium sp. ZSDE20]MCQ1058977.1 outer membrane protein transport protein [Photobacterium sp. ZSDE20]MDD1824008.1 outer membrane protein transport protein [Photobacterium sp. ZSDE20]
MRPLQSTLAVMSVLSLPVQASGIFLQEAVTANAGTAGAGDGVYTGSAAAMWANPATMSGMGESLTTFNVLGFDLEMKYRDNADNGDGKAHSVLPSAGAFHARQITDDIHVGIALGAVGGSSLSYGTEWAGAAALDEITLTAMQVNPAISYQINSQWSVGAGLQLSWASLEQSTSLLDIDKDTDWAFGANFGVMYQHDERLALGASYRTKLEHEFGTRVSGPTEAELFNSLRTDITVPAIADISASYALNPQLDLLASVQWHQWSEWDNTVMDFGIGFENGPATIVRDWDDVWKFAFGADYQLNRQWRLKGGFSYETSPQDDPTKQWVDVPVGEQYRYSVGAATKWNDVTIDMFYEYADLGEVDIKRNIPQLDGTFDSRIHFLGVSFTY